MGDIEKVVREVVDDMEVEEKVVGDVQQDETFWRELSLKSVLHPVNLLRSDLMYIQSVTLAEISAHC